MTVIADLERQWMADRALKPTLRNLQDRLVPEVIDELIGLAVSDSGFPPTVTIKNARIADRLVLARNRVNGHVRFLNCCFMSAPDFEDSEFGSLKFESCHFHAGANLTGVRAEHRLTLSECWAGGPVRLAGARMARLKLDGSTFDAAPDEEPDATALNANIMDVTRSLTAENARFYGEASFTGTRVGGELTLKGLVALRPKGIALQLREVTVARSAHLQSVKLRGRLSAQGLRLGGELNLDKAELISREASSWAVDLLSLSTGRWLNLSDTTICGPVRLSAAQIAGKVSIRRAVLSPRPSSRTGAAKSLIAEKVRVERDLDLRGAELGGSVFLPGAKIGGTVWFDGVTLLGSEAVNAAGATIDGNLVWTPSAVKPGATVDLRDVTVSRLVTQAGRWGGADHQNLVLSGLTYHSLDGDPSTGTVPSTEDLIRWLRQQKDFDMQPYRVLAEALKRVGRGDAARVILLAGERDQLRRGQLGFTSQVGGRLLSILTGFGYQLGRAFLLLVAVFLAGWVYFGAHRGDLLAESLASGGQTAFVKADVPCPLDVSPCFSAWEYALHSVVPALPLDQTNTWQARGAAHDVTVAFQITGWVAAGALAAALGRLQFKSD